MIDFHIWEVTKNEACNELGQLKENYASVQFNHFKLNRFQYYETSGEVEEFAEWVKSEFGYLKHTVKYGTA